MAGGSALSPAPVMFRAVRLWQQIAHSCHRAVHDAREVLPHSRLLEEPGYASAVPPKTTVGSKGIFDPKRTLEIEPVEIEPGNTPHRSSCPASAQSDPRALMADKVHGQCKSAAKSQASTVWASRTLDRGGVPAAQFRPVGLACRIDRNCAHLDDSDDHILTKALSKRRP